MVKIATPISHLFENKEYARLITKYSDCLEFRDASIDSQLSKQEAFHCELQPIHKLNEENFKYLEYLQNKKRDLKLLTFHIASSCDKPFIKNGIFEKGGREYSEKEALNNAKINFRRIRRIFSPKVRFAVENTNYYPTEAYKYITDSSFISRIVGDSKIDFLFDLAHARITAYNKGIDYEAYRDSLPLSRIIQIHLSSFKVVRRNLAFDAHDYPKPREFAEVKSLLENGNLKYLTVEYYKNTRCLINSLRILRGLL